MIACVSSLSSLPSRARKALAAYPELAAVLAAAIVGLSVQRPLAWLAAHHGIDALLALLVFATALTIDPAAPRRVAAAWRRVALAVALGVTVLPALSWAVSWLVPAGPLRDGVLVTGIAPAEIASVATTALAEGEAAVAAGVLIGSTLATVLLAAPILTLFAESAAFSPAGVIENLALVVALPLAAGMALRAWAGVSRAVAFLAAPRAERVATSVALTAVAALVALVASEVHLSAGYAAVAAALFLFLAASALLGRILAARSPRPVGAALLLTTSMRDFAIAAAIAAAAFGPQAAAPLGLYGVAVLIWGTACAAFFRNATATQDRLSRCPFHYRGDSPGNGKGIAGMIFAGGGRSHTTVLMTIGHLAPASSSGLTRPPPRRPATPRSSGPPFAR
jgi:predicted Na+-dependent transporter